MFDASISDWTTTLAAGATLVVPAPDRLAAPGGLCAELEHRAISHVDLPPALLAHLSLDRLPAALRVVVLGGEPCPIERIQTLARRSASSSSTGRPSHRCSSLVIVDPALDAPADRCAATGRCVSRRRAGVDH
jgi:non-ribosomal peptide synthetase component F